MAHHDEEDLELEETRRPFCPKCGSTDIRGSQTHRTLDYLLKTFSLRPYRCRSCRKRFYLRKPAEKIDGEYDGKVDGKVKEAQEVKESPPAP